MMQIMAEIQNRKNGKWQQSRQRHQIRAVNMVGVSLCWVSGLDCLLPIMTICLQSEQGSEMDREGCYIIHCILGRMKGDGLIAGWRAVGVLLILGMDIAAVTTAQQTKEPLAWSVWIPSLASIYHFNYLVPFLLLHTGTDK